MEDGSLLFHHGSKIGLFQAKSVLLLILWNWQTVRPGQIDIIGFFVRVSHARGSRLLSGKLLLEAVRHGYFLAGLLFGLLILGGYHMFARFREKMKKLSSNIYRANRFDDL